MELDLVRKLRGAGGKPKSPKRTKDTLIADDTVEILIAVSEGRINGIRNKTAPEKDFFVAGTPVQSPSGTWNYEGFVVEQYLGDPVGASPVHMVLGGFAESTTVNVPLGTGTAVTRVTSSGAIDAIDVRLRIDALYLENDNGVFEDDFVYTIQYREQGSSTWLNALPPMAGYTDRSKIRGKATRPYPLETRIPVTRATNPYEIRVIMWNNDASTTHIVSATWESFQEVDNQARTYNGTALVRFLGKATDQFSSIPALEGIYEGRILNVPTTYNEETQTYSGIWDGTWKLAFTDETVWVLADLITNPRYGYQKYNPNVSVDWPSFYETALKANARVSDGLGGERRKHTFNEVLAEARAGKAALAYVAGTMNSVVYDDGTGKLYLAMDSNDPIEQVFVPENITSDHFNYSFTDVNIRYNQITGTFVNPNLNWETDRRLRQLDDSIAANGVIPYDYIAVGCTNEAELLASINYKLLTANTETIQVSFRTPRNGFLVRPYGVIGIGDVNMGWGLTGRIKSIAGDVMTLRDPVHFETIGTKNMVIQSDAGVLELTINVASIGDTYTLTRSGGDSLTGLQDFAPFLIGEAKPFRVIKVAEVEGQPDFYDISAVEINRAKYTDMLTVDLSDLTNGSNLDRLQIAAPTDVAVNTAYIPTTAGVLPKFVISWTKSVTRGVKGYEIYAARNGEPEQLIGQTSDGLFEWINPTSGIYIINVVAKSMLGTKSMPAYADPLDFTDDSLASNISILNLRVDTGGTDFDGTNPQMVWESTDVATARGSAMEGTPTLVPLDDTTLRDYRVEVLTTADVLLRTEFTDQPRYLYTLDKNIEDGGPRRSVKIRVSVRDSFGNFGPTSTITIANAVPAVPTLVINKLFGALELNFTQPTDPDFRGYYVWMSTTNGFTPGPGNLVYMGAGNPTLTVNTGTTYYIRYAAYDEFGSTGLTLSTQTTITADRGVAQTDLNSTLSTLINTHTSDISTNATNIANEIIRASAAEGVLDVRATSMEVSGDRSLNGNPNFRLWTNPANPPDGWTSVGAGTRTRVSGATEVSRYSNQEVSTAANNFALRYDISILPGWYVVEADIIYNSGTLTGAGVYVDGAGNQIVFASTPDINNATLGASPTTGRRYRWRVLYQHTNATTARYLLACTAHSVIGSNATSRSITWENVRIRPAQAGEVENGVARAGLANLSARFTDVATTAATATAAVATRATALEVKSASPTALPERLSVRENWNNTGPITVPSGTAASTQGTIVAVQNEGDVVQLTGSTQAWWSRGWLPLTPGRTFRYTLRSRVTVDGTANVNRIGYTTYNENASVIAYVIVAQPSRTVADGWVEDTFQVTTSAAIAASSAAATYIRPFIRLATNTSTVYSGATVQAAFLRFEDITDVKTLEASITSVQTALTTADTAIVSSVNTLKASVGKAVLPKTFADSTLFTSDGSSNVLTANPPDPTVGTFPIISGIGQVWRSRSGATVDGILHKGYLPLIAGHSYFYRTKFRAIANSTNGNVLYSLIQFYCYDSTGAVIASGWTNNAGSFNTYTVASGWVEYSGTMTAADIWAIQPTACYIRFIVLKWSNTGSPDGQMEVQTMELRDTTEEAALTAAVTVAQGAITTLQGQMNAFYSIDVSTSASKAGFVISAGNISYFDIYADRFRVWDGTGRQQIFSVEGADVVFSGAIYSDKGVYLGTGGSSKWPVGLASKDFQVSDGDTITYGVTLPATPNFVMSTIGAATLTSGETYNFYIDSATTTSAIARLKISTPGTSTNYSKGPTSTNTGGTPKYALSKGADPDANSNLYTITCAFTVTFTILTSMQNDPITIQVTLPVYTKKAGVWTFEGNLVVDSPVTSYSTNGSKTYTFSAGGSITLTSAPTDFGVHNPTMTGTWVNDADAETYPLTVSSPGVTQLTSVAWTTTSSSGTRSATPAGQKCIVKVVPKN